MLENILTKNNLLIVGMVLICLLIVGMVIGYLMKENMDNVVSIQQKNDYIIPSPVEDLVEKSINENSVVINTNILKPLNDDTERSYPDIYKNNKITITPQSELEKQEFSAMVLPPVKPLQQVVDY